MKKIILSMFMLGLGLVGCGGSDACCHAPEVKKIIELSCVPGKVFSKKIETLPSGDRKTTTKTYNNECKIVTKIEMVGVPPVIETCEVLLLDSWCNSCSTDNNTETCHYTEKWQKVDCSIELKPKIKTKKVNPEPCKKVDPCKNDQEEVMDDDVLKNLLDDLFFETEPSAEEV